MSAISRDDLERLVPRIDTLSSDHAKQLYDILTSDAVARCSVDGFFWLSYVQTRDEADPEHSVKPFPVHLEYLRELWAILARDQRVVIAKSRQMLVSWAVCAFCVWWARHKPHQAIYWQTQKWADACGMVCGADGAMAGRCQFMEQR